MLRDHVLQYVGNHMAGSMLFPFSEWLPYFYHLRSPLLFPYKPNILKTIAYQKIPLINWEIPCGLAQRICLQCRRHKRHGFNSWVGKIPRRRKWQPTHCLSWKSPWTEESGGGYSPQGHKEPDMTEHACIYKPNIFQNVALSKNSIDQVITNEWLSLDAGKDWGHEEKGATEDEMVGWHHQLNERVVANSRRWWRIGKPGMLQSTRL